MTCIYEILITDNGIKFLINVDKLDGYDSIEIPFIIQKNGVEIGRRPILNFIEGNNITLYITDDPNNNRINIEIGS